MPILQVASLPKALALNYINSIPTNFDIFGELIYQFNQTSIQSHRKFIHDINHYLQVKPPYDSVKQEFHQTMKNKPKHFVMQSYELNGFIGAPKKN